MLEKRSFFLAPIAKVIKNTKGESKGSGKGKGGALSWLDVQGLAMLGLFGGEDDGMYLVFVSKICIYIYTYFFLILNSDR